MNQEFLDNNYLFVPEFIPTQEANDLYKQFKKETQLYPHNFDNKDPQAPGSPSIHNYVPFVALMCEKTAHMNKLVGEKLLPTYAYARIYKNGAELVKHKDRPACEVSVTLHLGSDGTSWPLGFTRPDGSTVLNTGQGSIIFSRGAYGASTPSGSFDSSGNLLVGTTSPTYSSKLSIYAGATTGTTYNVSASSVFD